MGITVGRKFIIVIFFVGMHIIPAFCTSIHHDDCCQHWCAKSRSVARVYRAICLSDHNYARLYHSKQKKNCVEVGDCNSKTSDDSSCVAGRPPVVPQGSSIGSPCGSRVGQPATRPRPRRPPYSQYHCAVYRCATNCHRAPGVTCHAFPRDESLQREWLARCKRTGEVNVRIARVCSVHFRPEDYRRDLRNELLGLPLRKKLIPTAVPSLNLPSQEEDELRDVCTKPQGSSIGSPCGSRVGQPATRPRPRRPPYSQYHCAVYRCATNCHRAPGVTCHAFPRDESLQREWLARCKRTGEVNVRIARVCSVHFRPEDYRRDLRNELLGLPLRKKLIPTAVPSLNLPSQEEDELRDVCTKKLGRLRKKLRKCDDYDEGGNMDAVVQQILMNPPEVIIKEEPVLKEESECGSGDVGTGAQQDFGYVSVKEEPIEDLDESTSSAPEDFEYVSVNEGPIEDLDESTSSAPESYEQMRQDQELPLIIKEEIDCDDYIDPFHIS